MREFKWCTFCEREKPLSEFEDNGRGALTSRCRICRRYFSRERERRKGRDPRFVRRRNRRRAELRLLRSPRAARRVLRLATLVRPHSISALAAAWAIDPSAARVYLRRLEQLGLVRRRALSPRRVFWEAQR